MSNINLADNKTASGQVTLKRAAFSVEEWVGAMQAPEHRAKVFKAVIRDNGVERSIQLYSERLDSFSFSAREGKPFLNIYGRSYEVLSVSKTKGSTLFFTPSGIEASIINRPDNMTYNIGHFFELSPAFKKASSLFNLEDLCHVYQQPQYKASISSVVVRNNVHRFVSLTGVPADSYSFNIKDEKLFLKIWGKEFDVEAVNHRNGRVVLLGAEHIRVFTPKGQHLSDITPAVSPLKKSFTSEKLPEELELYRKIVNDFDLDALTQFYAKERRKLVRYANKICRNDEMAEDAVQIAFETLLNLRASNLRGETASWCKDYKFFNTWMHKIIHSEVCKQIAGSRKNEHAQLTTVSLDNGGDEQNHVMEVADKSVMSDPLNFLLSLEGEGHAVDIISRISGAAANDPAIDAAFQFGQGASHASLASQFGCAIGTVKSRISRGRAKLAELGLVQPFMN